jgi:hypothetical protein
MGAGTLELCSLMSLGVRFNIDVGKYIGSGAKLLSCRVGEYQPKTRRLYSNACRQRSMSFVPSGTVSEMLSSAGMRDQPRLYAGRGDEWLTREVRLAHESKIEIELPATCCVNITILSLFGSIAKSVLPFALSSQLALATYQKTNRAPAIIRRPTPNRRISSNIIWKLLPLLGMTNDVSHHTARVPSDRPPSASRVSVSIRRFAFA